MGPGSVVCLLGEAQADRWVGVVAGRWADVGMVRVGWVDCLLVVGAPAEVSAWA